MYGTTIGVINGNARRLDYRSHAVHACTVQPTQHIVCTLGHVKRSNWELGQRNAV